MKNNLSDLKNYLFAQIERLDDEEITEEQLRVELARTSALTKISKEILEIGRLELDAIKHSDEQGYKRKNEMPKFLSSEDE